MSVCGLKYTDWITQRDLIIKANEEQLVLMAKAIITELKARYALETEETHTSRGDHCDLKDQSSSMPSREDFFKRMGRGYEKW